VTLYTLYSKKRRKWEDDEGDVDIVG